jgi:CheY-like chemotaxis protein
MARIQLPGIDGLEAIPLLERDDATRAIPVIALTALAMKGDEERIRVAGCDGYIAKPMSLRSDHRDSAGPDMNPSPGIADHPRRILIVDDECDNRELLEVILGWEGFLILSAASGEEALVTMGQQPVDLILLDVMMPGMNGFEVVAKIKGNLATKNIPVILVSALADRNARTLGLNAGAEDFLGKPLERGELVLRVKDLLRKTYADYHDN